MLIRFVKLSQLSAKFFGVGRVFAHPESDLIVSGGRFAELTVKYGVVKVVAHAPLLLPVWLGEEGFTSLSVLGYLFFVFVMEFGW